jgi:cobalamin biosynthesis Mg chelatase CobN
LQISSVRQSMRTGAPPMLGNAGTPDPVAPDAAQRSTLPSFMQDGPRAQAPAPEPVNLISANDLPEWIRQIAEADAAKAEAEAEAAAARQLTDAPASTMKRPLPGTAPSTAPSTTWLSKSSNAADAVDHWATETTAAAEPAPPAYPTITPSQTYMPSLHELSAASAKKRKFSRGMPSSTSGTPIYRNRTVQLAALVLLLALLAATIL